MTNVPRVVLFLCCIISFALGFLYVMSGSSKDENDFTIEDKNRISILDPNSPLHYEEGTFTSRRKIYFLETLGTSNLNLRQACAVESAARHHHSDFDVLLLMLSPNIQINDDVMRALLAISNVKLRYLDVNAIFAGTVMDQWKKMRKVNNDPTQFNTELYSSDALPISVLWKYGGIYLDFDMVVLKSMRDFINCVALETPTSVDKSVLIFDEGHSYLTRYLLELLERNPRGSTPQINHTLLTRALEQVCGGVKDPSRWTRGNCQGVRVLPSDIFYSIQYNEWTAPNAATSFLSDALGRSYIFHGWNKFGTNAIVKIGSGQLYEVIANKFCPSVYDIARLRGYF